MGCDIHVFTEAQFKRHDGSGVWINQDKWQACTDAALYPEEMDSLTESSRYAAVYDSLIYTGRNYHLFGMLAGVRSDLFTPISAPKGIPTGCSYQTMASILRYGADGHSHSYLTLAEILAYDWERTITVTNVASERSKEAMSESSELYPNLRFKPNPLDKGYLYEYDQVPKIEARDFYSETIPALQRIVDRNKFSNLTPDDVRIVFFFDN